jgi:hypothetical protein
MHPFSTRLVKVPKDQSRYQSAEYLRLLLSLLIADEEHVYSNYYKIDLCYRRLKVQDLRHHWSKEADLQVDIVIGRTIMIDRPLHTDIESPIPRLYSSHSIVKDMIERIFGIGTDRFIAIRQ